MPKLSPLFILSLSATLLMLGVGMIVSLLPQRIYAMTGSLESVGLVASVFALSYLLAQLPVSALSDRFGPKYFLVIGYFFCALSGIVFFSIQTAGGIFFGRAVQGLGEAPIWALGPAVLSLTYPSAKGRAIGIYNAMIHAGLTAGPLLGLFIAPEGPGRMPFLVFAVLCFVAGLVILVFLRPVSGAIGHTKPTLAEFLGLLRQRQVVVLLLGVVIYGAGYGCFLTVLPVSLASTHGFGPTATSLLFVLFYAAISLSQLFAGARSDRIGRHGFLVWGMALAAAGLAAVPFFNGQWAYLPYGMASAGLGVFCVASIAELNESAPDSLKGAISGSYYFFWATGCVLGPLTVGTIGTTSSSVGFAFLAILFGLQSLAVSLMQK